MIASGFAGLAYWQRGVAIAERDQALRRQSLFLAEMSRQETARGNATNGILLALEALPKDIDQARPTVRGRGGGGFISCGQRRTRAIRAGRPHRSGWSAAFSPDGTRVVTASDDQTARLSDADLGPGARHPGGHTGAVWSAAFSPDGTRVVTASDDDDRAAVGRRQRARRSLTLEGHTGAVIVGGVQPGRHAGGHRVR